MRRWPAAIILIGISIFVAVLAVWFFRPAAAPPRELQPNAPGVQMATNHARPRAATTSVPIGSTGHVQSSAPTVPAGLASPAESPNSVAITANILAELRVESPDAAHLPPATVMENMHSAIRQYGLKFNGNPVGTNLEITRALYGENPKQTKFLRLEDGMRVNSKGELIDPWGTPFFFHQLSATQMEIHSAGPDKVLGTRDDLVIK